MLPARVSRVLDRLARLLGVPSNGIFPIVFGLVFAGFFVSAVALLIYAVLTEGASS